MAYNKPWQTQRQDTGWGLIYRLNLLMGKIENDLEAGDLEKWNLHMDRIYVNILYKNPEELVNDEKGKVVDIKFSKDDVQVFQKFAAKIEELKIKMRRTREIADEDTRRFDMAKLRADYYNLLFRKDIWIRKKMFESHLYLRAVEHDPRKAIYGG